MDKATLFLETLNSKYGPAIIAGLVGAFIARLRKKMTIRYFISSVIIAVFVSIGVSFICKDYFDISENLTNVCCGVSGVFSRDLLNEIEEIIKDLSGFVKKKIGEEEK